MRMKPVKPPPPAKADYTKLIIPVIGSALVFFGLLNLFRHATVVFQMFLVFFDAAHYTAWPVVLIAVVYAYVLPLCFIAGGAGFLLLKRWALKMVLAVILVDFLIELNGLITYWFLAFTGREYLIIPSGAEVTHNQLMLLYAVIFLEVVALYFLSSPRLKRRFVLAQIENRINS